MKTLNDEKIIDLAEIFKVFGDSTRIRILCALESGELNVGALTEIVGTTQSAVSHQLRILKSADLIRNRRDGREMYYSLADGHVRTIMEMMEEHLEENKIYEK